MHNIDYIDRIYRKKEHITYCDIENFLPKEHNNEQELGSTLHGAAFYEKLHEMLLFASLPGGRSGRN